MPKKRRTSKKRNISKKNVINNNFEEKFMSFLRGALVFFLIEAVFMLGGLYLQIRMNIGGSTGIPSLLGLVLWLVFSAVYSKKKYFFIGGIITSFLVPIILIIVMLTGFVSFQSIMYYTTALFIILEIISLLLLTKKS